jgi:hypothetical protein
MEMAISYKAIDPPAMEGVIMNIRLYFVRQCRCNLDSARETLLNYYAAMQKNGGKLNRE